MFGGGIKLFTLFGFEVRLHVSWILIALLITWSLARGIFPARFYGLSSATYWWMGAVGAIGLFVSIVLHEFGHSIVARGFGIPMRGITLFIFGGVAEMGDEPPTAKSEFFMAIAGPVTSIALAGIFYGFAIWSESVPWPLPAFGILGYLAWINLALAAFNMIPAFPLDGGRVLRSILWAVKRNFRWATRIASALGTAFAFLLIAFGAINFFLGAFIGGFWWVILGIFLRYASRASYQHALLREALEGEHVRRFMVSNPVTVPPAASLRDVVENYVYKYHHKMFPVATDAELVGCVSLDKIKQVPAAEWEQHTARELAKPCSPEEIVTPEEDAASALARLNRGESNELMVVEQGHLVGVVFLKDMLRFLSLKRELEPA